MSAMVGLERPTGGPDREAFVGAMAELPAGVTMLTTWAADGRPVGATLSAVCSLSLDPPLVLACLDHASDTLRALTAAGQPFLLHVAAEGQEAVVRRCAGKGEDKFDGIPWRRGLDGLPEIEGSAVRIACAVDALVPGGDHTIVVGAVRSVEGDAARRPLVYHRRTLAVSPIESEVH